MLITNLNVRDSIGTGSSLTENFHDHITSYLIKCGLLTLLVWNAWTTTFEISSRVSPTSNPTMLKATNMLFHEAALRSSVYYLIICVFKLNMCANTFENIDVFFLADIFIIFLYNHNLFLIIWRTCYCLLVKVILTEYFIIVVLCETRPNIIWCL